MKLRTRATRNEGELCSDLARRLAEASSGVAFVYSTLDRLVSELECGDMVLVLNEPLVGRQVFRAGRLPLDDSWAAGVAAHAGPGLYCRDGSPERDLCDTVIGLCTVAVRLDVVGHDAAHDALTGLLNRRSFDEALLAAVAQSHRYGWPFTLALLDVQGFKAVNDSLGHAAGDAVLRALGNALRAGMRAGDVMARIGGDEFALILPNSAPELLPRLALRLEQEVAAAVPGAEVHLTMGVARSPADCSDPDELFRLADQRLYETRAVR